MSNNYITANRTLLISRTIGKSDADADKWPINAMVKLDAIISVQHVENTIEITHTGGITKIVVNENIEMTMNMIYNKLNNGAVVF